MFKSKTFFVLIFSAVAIIITSMIAVSCTSNENEDVPVSNNSIGEELTIGNDTIYVETEVPIIQKSTISSVSDKTRELIELSIPSNTRSNEETEIYYLYDEWTEKWAYAISTESHSCIFECYGAHSDTPLIIIFEEVDTNEFVTKDENGNVLRHFSYDPEKRELWTFNEFGTRGMSTQDKILCNSMFAAANYLVCEALAVPTGGASLVVALGFAVASTYICD